ncbi:MAG TPA: FGLLP motif-containing membrane protein [Acidimicrobiales bacterium]|nr:FGLLP motif-containing membrane protein [Acidimicrobiales bacterium]
MGYLPTIAPGAMARVDKARAVVSRAFVGLAVGALWLVLGSPLAVAAGGSVHAVSVTLSTPAEAATEVTYTVEFTTSHTGALAAHSSWVEVDAAPGTLLPTCVTQFIDVTAGQSFGNACSNVAGAKPGSRQVIGAPINVAAGDTLRLVFDGSTNPGPGAKTLAVRTSGDPSPVIAKYAVSGSAYAPSKLSVQLSTSAKGAAEATYTVRFTTSSLGALTAHNSWVEVDAAPGTVLPTCANQLADVTSSDTFINACSVVPGAKPGPHQVIGLPMDIAAGDTVQLVFDGATNPGPGAKTLSVHTSSDYRPATTRYSVSPAVYAPSKLSVQLSTPTKGASEVRYVATFTTSRSGALVAGNSWVALDAAPGTVLPTCAARFVDVTASHTFLNACSAVPGSKPGPHQVIGVPIDVAAGDTVQLVLAGATNPGAGAKTLGVQTSSDYKTATTGYTISPTVYAVSHAQGTYTPARGSAPASYAVAFTTSPHGALVAGSSTVVIRLPPGLSVPTCAGSFSDLTTSHNWLNVCNGTPGAKPGSQQVLTVPFDVSGGDRLQFVFQGVTGSPTGGDLRVSTSSDYKGEPGTAAVASPGPPPTKPQPAPAPTSSASKAAPSSIAVSLPSLAQAFGSISSDATGAALTVGAALFLTFPSNVFNSTFEDNYDDIAAWWRKWTARLVPAWLRRRSREGQVPVGRTDVGPGTRQRLEAFTAVLVAGALLGSLLDPAWSLNLATLISFISVLVAMLAGVGISYVVSGGYHAARRHGRVPARLQALPAGLVVAAVCVVISRATSFAPGYLYGVVCGVNFTRKLEPNEEGHVVALGAYVKVLLAVTAWAAWAWFTHDAAKPGSGFAHVLVDDFLASLFVSNMVSTVVSLFPLRFMPGHKLHQWHQGVWWGTFGMSAFVLVQVLLHPHTTGKGSHSAPVLTTIGLFVVFGGGSLLFREHFARKKRRAKAVLVPAPDEAGPGVPGAGGEQVGGAEAEPTPGGGQQSPANTAQHE